MIQSPSDGFINKICTKVWLITTVRGNTKTVE